MINGELKLSEDIYNANIELESTRQGFGDALAKLGETEENIVVLTGDLSDSTKVKKFAERFPKRFFQIGIAEQNMAGIAAGLAINGKIPFATSFASFNPGRNWEQIRLAISYTNANVKIVGSHAGFSAAKDGATHQALEDIALMRVLPNMVVLYPTDYLQTQEAVEAATKHNGPVYIRVNRNKSPIFTTRNTPFDIGKAQILQKGSDVTLATTGPLAYEALLAARELELNYRIKCEVINFHTIKPFDKETLIKSAGKTTRVITIEEHQIAGGLGSTIAETLSEQLPTHVYRMGAMDTFGESGDYEELLKKYGLNKEAIVEKVRSIK